MTVYRFMKDEAWPKPVSNCTGDCVKKWPIVSPVDFDDTKGIKKKGYMTFTRPDGAEQQTINCWPIYTFMRRQGARRHQRSGRGRHLVRRAARRKAGRRAGEVTSSPGCRPGAAGHETAPPRTSGGAVRFPCSSRVPEPSGVT